MKKISLFKPFIGAEEVREVAKTLRSGWITLGPKTEEFELAFAIYVGTKHAVGLNSATAALHLALVVSNVKRGDEVITPALTFASTAEAALIVGARPVFADVDPRTLNIDPRSIEKKITKKTKAIIVVHYGGQPCDMDEINKIGKKHGIPIIEDAAHAMGSTYKGKKIGGGENIACFSFQAVKNLTTGDGGMITTNDASVNKRLRSLRWCGINKSTHERVTAGGYRWDYDIDEEGGFKYHMNDINAAIGIVQLKRLDAMNEKRRQIIAVYDAALKNSKTIRPVVQLPGRKTSPHNYCVLLKGYDREALISYLIDKGISTGVHYKPLYHHPRYKKFGSAQDTPITEAVWPEILLLPLHPQLSVGDARRVVTALLSFKA
ncbi:MAG: Glutamine--scyllo-inositol transaminase [Candidatus Kaiserbacteria bacterium]|nr:Glutamine--scyllo-inositol transaminase [Candidatus Kaiserbacteria bacterium]